MDERGGTERRAKDLTPAAESVAIPQQLTGFFFAHHLGRGHDNQDLRHGCDRADEIEGTR